MKELYNSIRDVFKLGGYSFLLLLVVLFFSADSVSIYFLILFGLVQLPLLFARDGSRHIISLLVFSFSYALIWYMTGTISSIAILISICLFPSIFFLYGSKIGKHFDYSKELPIALPPHACMFVINASFFPSLSKSICAAISKQISSGISIW